MFSVRRGNAYIHNIIHKKQSLFFTIVEHILRRVYAESTQGVQ